MSANDKQIGGEHYKGPGKTEHWDFVVQHGLDYFQGQIIKYTMRWKKKGGIQDLKKAQHFLEKYIEVESTKSTTIDIRISNVENLRKTAEMLGLSHLLRTDEEVLRIKFP